MLERRKPLRRTEFKRSKPMERGSGLKRGKPVKPVSDRRQAAKQQEREVWARVQQRDGGCVLRDLQHDPVVGRCWGRLTPHHKQKASQGGLYVDSNIVVLCVHHNDEIEANADLAARARQLGLVLKREDITQGENQ